MERLIYGVRSWAVKLGITTVFANYSINSQSIFDQIWYIPISPVQSIGAKNHVDRSLCYKRPSWPVGVVKLWHKQFKFNHIKGNRNLFSYAQWYCKWVSAAV